MYNIIITYYVMGNIGNIKFFLILMVNIPRNKNALTGQKPNNNMQIVFVIF